jgi:hypothetical protein
MNLPYFGTDNKTADKSLFFSRPSGRMFIIYKDNLT